MYAVADGKSILFTFTHKGEIKSLCERIVDNLMIEKMKHSDVRAAHGLSDPYGLLDQGFCIKTMIIVFYKLSKNKFNDGPKIKPLNSYMSRNINEIENIPIGVYYFDYFERKKDKVTTVDC